MENKSSRFFSTLRVASASLWVEPLVCRPAYAWHMLRWLPLAGTLRPYGPHAGLVWEFCEGTTNTHTLRILYTDLRCHVSSIPADGWSLPLYPDTSPWPPPPPRQPCADNTLGYVWLPPQWGSGGGTRLGCSWGWSPGGQRMAWATTWKEWD